jgi:deoxyribodipyrimidine photo-lyase
MPETAVMWFRRDLRVRDLPALAAAARFDRTVPVFVFDERLLTKGRFPSAVRTQFMVGCLRELDAALRERGGRLVLRHGRPEQEILTLVEETGAEDVFWTADASPSTTPRASSPTRARRTPSSRRTPTRGSRPSAARRSARRRR